MNEQRDLVNKEDIEEVVIDDTNFHLYFKDCRNKKPDRGDIIAKFTAIADFVGGVMKRDIINLLYNKEDKINAALQVMRKLGCATEKDSIRICKEICSDIYNGMSLEEVEAKVYKYQLEVFYYTKKDYVPLDDPHWSVISIANLDEFLDKSGTKLRMESKFTTKESDEQKEQEVQ